MPTELRITERDYYDLTPSLALAAGDVWVDLPPSGWLGSSNSAGIVITPACDLANRKVDTLTFLPIIPLTSYFSTTGFLPEVARETRRQLRAAGLEDLMLDEPTATSLYSESEVGALVGIVDHEIGSSGTSVQRIQSLQKARSGLLVAALCTM